MVKKVIGATLILVILVVFNVNLDAQDRRVNQRMGYGIWMAEQNLFPVYLLLKFKEEIGLTDVQVENIEKIRLKHQELAIKKSSEVKLKELKLVTLLKNDKVNRSAMEKMIREIGMMKTDLAIQRIHFMLDVKKVLSEEQIQKIENLKKEMRIRRFQRQPWDRRDSGPQGNRKFS